MIKDSQARITSNENWGDYYLLTIESAGVASLCLPGQFIMVRISAHPYPLLRRPFSIHAKDTKTIQIFFQKTGLGTELLSQKRAGEYLDILGPLGKGFTAEPILKGKEVITVGGGRGIAPLYFLARMLRSRETEVKIFYGGKSLIDLPLKDRFEKDGFEMFFSTDDGSFGFKGFISDYLEAELDKLNPDYLYACGPEEMMKKIAFLSRARNIPAEFSLESIMGCGFGACWGCVRRIKKDREEGWLKICEEGPVFSAEEIIWTVDDK